MKKSIQQLNEDIDKYGPYLWTRLTLDRYLSLINLKFKKEKENAIEKIYSTKE